MNEIRFVCPHCNQYLQADSQYCNKEMRCPSCSKDFIVPATSKPLPPLASIAPPSTEIVYAGFWRRFIALIIDGFVLSTANFIIILFFAIIMGVAFGRMFISPDHQFLQCDDHKVTVPLGMAIFGISFSFFSFVIKWLYYTLFESSSMQATPGKLLLGLVVTDMNRMPISFARANCRYWGKIISNLTFFVGYIMAGFTERKQALHDIIAKCLVIEK